MNPDDVHADQITQLSAVSARRRSQMTVAIPSGLSSDTGLKMTRFSDFRQ
jgi:hypothetical protein